MTGFYSIEVDADRHEDTRDLQAALYAELDAQEAMWARIAASNRGEVTLSDAEVEECNAFLLEMMAAD